MPAVETRGLAPGAVLGIIAGGGVLPGLLASACEKLGIATFIVAFNDRTDPGLYETRPHLLTRPGRAGLILRTLREKGISDIVMIGALRRPSFFELRPDWRAAIVYANILRRALGDDGLLRAVRAEVEKKGFRLHGIQEFLPDILGPAGPIGKYKPGDGDWPGIRRGIEASQMLGRLDIGQSVFVHEGRVIGAEDMSGTDDLILRCGRHLRVGGGILVKTCKPGQDRALDLPTIGIGTVETASSARLKGIVYQAGHTLLADVQAIAAAADREGMFVVGVDI